MVYNTQFSVENDNVIMNWNKFWDFSQMCTRENVGQDINKRSCLYNDSEVAYDALRSFFEISMKQLKQGFEVVFLNDNGTVKERFGNYDDFILWINESIFGSNSDFIKESVLKELL